jgi:glycosyltransferase involved in cell wall biosynthesis
MPKLSITIITYNEEDNIRKCLESVKGLGEIIIVDSCSNDNTLNICREFTDRVYVKEWLGYTKQKNLAIDIAEGEWILSIDADEYVEGPLREEIHNIINSDTKYDGYFIPRKTIFLNKWMKHGGWYPDYNLRLFKKGKGIFREREVHESLKLDGKAGYTRNAIIHNTFKNLYSYISKINNYSTLSVREMLKDGISPFKTNSLNLLFRPLFTFFHKYILRLGFLDGKHGLILNLYHSFYVFSKYSKAWEEIYIKSDR